MNLFNTVKFKTAFLSAVAFSLVLFAGIAQGATTTIRFQNGNTSVNGTIYNGAEDTYLRQPYPEASPGMYPEMEFGYDNYGAGGKVRPMMRFDISNLKDNWAANTRITAARVRLSFLAKAGANFTNTVVRLYRVAPANASWRAGTTTNRTTAEMSAASWKWLTYDNTNYAPDDNVNCPNPGAGCPRRHPWAGDVAAMNAVWPNLTAYTGSGCGVAGTDYITTLVGADTISSTDAGGSITFSLTDLSFLSDWVNSPSTNSGFILICSDFESAVKGGAYSTVRVPSCESPSQAARPLFEIDVENLDLGGTGIQYTLDRASKVSMSIFNSQGREIKKLAVSGQRLAGIQTEFWNCKNDSINYGDVIATVPDGEYTAKILAHQGLTSEYMHTLGTTMPHWIGWPGNHGGNPAGVAVQDTSVVYTAPKGFWHSEGVGVTALAMKPDGTRLISWVDYGNPRMGNAYCDDVEYDNGNCYAKERGTGKIFMWTATVLNDEHFVTLITGPTTTVSGWTNSAYSVNSFDFDVYNGFIAMTSEANKKLYWYNAATGAAISEVTLTGTPYGVTIDNNGKALVIVDMNKVVSYTQGSATATTVVSAGLDGAFRLDVNHANGDFYIAEGGLCYPTGSDKIKWSGGTPDQNGVIPLDSTGSQVKRFSAAGALIATFGKLGGRPLYGKYVATDFRCVGDIAVATDGSFWIAEDGGWTGLTLPRRITHFSGTGAVIKEFYGGMSYSAQAFPDPEDPSIVWIPNSYGVIRAKVDWVAKSWSVLGCYSMHVPPFTYGNNHSWRISIIKRAGKTYIYQPSAVYYFDETNDRLDVVAYAGSSKDLWYRQAALMGPDSAIIAAKSKLIVNSIRSGLTDPSYLGSEPWGCWGGNLSWWWDKNGDRNMFQADEWAWSTNYLRCIGYTGILATKSGRLYGNTVTDPIWHTVGGVEIPEYNFNNARWVSSYVDSALKIRDPNSNAETYGQLIDESLVIPGRLEPKGGWHMEYPDKDGNLFELYTGIRCNSIASDPTAQRMANVLLKRDSTGKCLWSTSLRFTASAYPSPGELSTNPTDAKSTGCAGSNLYELAGTAQGCLFAYDQSSDINYVWDKDGLWVGNPLHNKAANMLNLPWSGGKSQRWGCGEMFASYIYEVENNNTPGLNQGDVLLFATGDNDIPVLKIGGFDQFARTTLKITVQGGVITGTSIKSREFSQNTPNVNCVIRSVAGKQSISYTLPSRQDVTMELYTILGAKVATLVNRKMEKGTHEVALDESTLNKRILNNGFYVVRLKAGATKITKQIVMVK